MAVLWYRAGTGSNFNCVAHNIPEAAAHLYIPPDSIVMILSSDLFVVAIKLVSIVILSRMFRTIVMYE